MARLRHPLAAGLLIFGAAALGLFILTRPGSSEGEARPAAVAAAQTATMLASYPWAYQRPGLANLDGEAGVSVLAVGDVLLGRGVAAEPDPWRQAGDWLAAADLTLGNLEGVLLEGGIPRRAPAGEAQPILLRGAPAAAGPLTKAGFDLMGLANNHSLDYGPKGLAATAANLEEAGLVVIGLASDANTNQPIIQEINGVRLAFLAFNAVPDPRPELACPPEQACSPRPVQWDPDAGSTAIAAAKGQADALIVSVHWGFEYETRPDPAQETAAQAMLAAGADLIVGHHPHVAQPIAISGTQVIAYSLGNFVFDQGNGATGQGLALWAEFDQAGLLGVKLLPVQASPQPRLLSPAEGADLLARVLPPPARLAFICAPAGCSPTEAGSEPAAQSPAAQSPAAQSPAAETGLFYAGQIDLTGDGQPETVRREGSRVSVYQQGELAWQSPADWRVVDAALGDPNDDGRAEIMLAIWRKDGAGYERSQPYLVGYRGGEYALLWGGRPVVDPIQELALGDVDGDGANELIVIEELADGSAQAVAVWRWTGWTFSLVWRSAYGRYRDLVVQDLVSADGDRPTLSVVLSGSVGAPGQ